MGDGAGWIWLSAHFQAEPRTLISAAVRAPPLMLCLPMLVKPLCLCRLVQAEGTCAKGLSLCGTASAAVRGEFSPLTARRAAWCPFGNSFLFFSSSAGT